MKPDISAQLVLSTTRATAKMHEFRAAPDDFIALPRNPSVLFGLAVGILGDVASATSAQLHADINPATIATPVPPAWEDGDPTPENALRFASLFFDAYVAARLEESISSEVSLLCASAYYLSRSVGSAAVVTRNMEAPPIELAGGLARLVYLVLSNDFGDLSEPAPYGESIVEVLRALRAYFSLDGSATSVAAACAALRKETYYNGSPRDLLYADVATAICANKLRYASRTILPGKSDLSIDLWKPALQKPRFPIELWPAQQHIADRDLLSGKCAVIQMPTSAGKTRATELIIRAAFLSKRASLAVIVAPYRSLCHDIRGDLTIAFSSEPVILDEVSDSYRPDLNLDDLTSKQTVLIVTPEKLLYLLRREPTLAQSIGLIIYDEGHQFDGIARGPTYELLLTSLRMLLPPSTQVILISAVIGNASEVASWLINDANAVVAGEGLLPTTKSIAFASWQDLRGRLEYVSPDDPDQREFFVPRIISETPLALRGRERVEKRFPEKDDGGDIGLFLGLHVIQNGSVAVFCGRKDSAAKLCRRVVDIFDRGVSLPRPIDFSDINEVERIRALSEANLGADASATRAASLGIFAHHADTPHGLRLAIEHAMKEGLVRFVVCTSTLAQGVNFPLKYLIVTSIRQGSQRILVRDFHNLMGRAGRAGMHTEGSVIFSTPTLYDQRRRPAQRWRWAEAKLLLNPANSEPAKSSILSLFSDYEQRQKDAPPLVLAMKSDWLNLAFADASRVDAIVSEAVEMIPTISTKEFRRFVEDRARIVQSIASFLLTHTLFDGEDVQARAGELAAGTLAHHLADEATRQKLIATFESIATAIAESTGSEQRAYIRRSPLPPRTVAELQVWLTKNLEAARQAAAEGRLGDFVLATILSYANAPTFQSLSDKSVLPQILTEWISGRSFAALYATLREKDVRVSGDRITIEDTVALCESGFGYYAAMVAASLADLIEEVDEDLAGALALFQKQIKYGLSDYAAIAFLEAGFQDRVVALKLAGAWPSVDRRVDVKNVCRTEAAAVRAVLVTFPSYFSRVAIELAN